MISLLSLFLYLLSTLATCYLIHCLLTFTTHLRQARASGLPYIVMPYAQNNVLNITFFSSESLPRLTRRYLPAWFAERVEFSSFSCRWPGSQHMFKKLGRVFLIVSPGALACHVADAEVASHIYRSRQKFGKQSNMYRLLEIYGTNILTSDDSGWAHHRHHTASAFSEKNNALVWKETMKQVTGMQDNWMIKQNKDPSSHPTDFDVPSSREDILKLTLQVISSAGFGVSLPFMQTQEKSSKTGPKSIYEDGPLPPPGYSFTFRSVTLYMQTHFRSIVFAVQLIPEWIPRFMKAPFFKAELAAFNDMGKYLRNLISLTEESGADDQNSDSLAHLMVGSSARSSSSKFRELTPDEVLGNLHIFTVAGHETTATTLRFALVLLTLHPEQQKWVRRGIHDALQGQSEDPKEWDYAEVFPKLVTPLCLMSETLRLCPPVISIPKWPPYSPVELEVEGKTHHIPQWTSIDVNADGLHYDTKYWGPDATSFDPTRWDASNKDSYLASNDSTSRREYSTIHRPVRGSFVAFSDGLRSCVGKKFAEVEFVAIFAVLLRDYEVLLSQEPGESLEKARERAWEVFEGSRSILTLSMWDDVPLRFRRAS